MKSWQGGPAAPFYIFGGESATAMFRSGYLVLLLAGWASAQAVKASNYPPECQKLVAEFKYCGEDKKWENPLQEYFAKMLGTPDFVNRTKECMEMSIKPGEGSKACTERNELQILLHCAKMSLFNLVSVEKKYASVKFYIGFQHCVQVQMGYLPHESSGGMPAVKDQDESGGRDPLNQMGPTKRSLALSHETEDDDVIHKIPDQEYDDEDSLAHDDEGDSSHEGRDGMIIDDTGLAKPDDEYGVAHTPIDDTGLTKPDYEYGVLKTQNPQSRRE